MSKTNFYLRRKMAVLQTARVLLLFFLPVMVWGSCNIPAYFHGDWYSRESGTDIKTLVNADKWDSNEDDTQLECVDIFIHSNPGLQQDGNNVTMLMIKTGGTNLNTCYMCVDVLWRTPNILQYRQEDCITARSGSQISLNDSCKSMNPWYGLPSIDVTFTMFKQSLEKINCVTTFEGVYQFSYEVDTGGGGICNHPDSQIKACQEPGSQYVDNEVFVMTYRKCLDVSTSKNEQIRYQCMGSWFAVRSGIGYTYAAVADTVEQDTREKFKCMMTLKNQKDANNQIRWVMSRFPDCTSLSGVYRGPLKLVLTRIAPPTQYMIPRCNLPRDIAGKWFTQGPEFKSNVAVNETHIHFNTGLNEFEFQDAFYSCQQTLGTRYLMTKVLVGKCEVDFVCMDIVPRHHSIVRYRIGKPARRLSDKELQDANYLETVFRDACSWMSFTFNRDIIDWKYEVLIQNPPTPYPCPVGGRYNFVQHADKENEKYQTRIRGVTQKPRVQVDCRIVVSEMKSCSNDLTKIFVDAEYCETVDYRGRPIGEYDVSDHELTCVGFWMEDYKSYLVTWDEEDAISSFRCWVYERASWTTLHMSRAQNARCNKKQEALDYQMAGTGLMLEMIENERLFDNCPQRFDSGVNPYKLPNTIWVLNTAAGVRVSHWIYSLTLAVISLLVLR